MAEDEKVFEEEEVDPSDPRIPRVLVQPHPLGGIQIAVRGADGTITPTRIEMPEATLLAAHLQALITMGFSGMYQAHAERESSTGIVIPGGGR